MNNKEILENNKLIAEFMGGIFPIDIATLKPSINKVILNGTTYYFEHNFSTNTVKYHSSWDWLMSVIYKCLNYYPTTIEEEKAWNLNCVEGSSIQKAIKFFCFENIETTYKEVVLFIKWYNENNSQKKG